MAQLTVLKGAGGHFDTYKWSAGHADEEFPAIAFPVHSDHTPPTIDIEAEKKAARQQGFEAGESAARARFEEALEQVNRELAKSVHGISQLRSQVIFDARNDLLQLSLQIARRVIHRELNVEPGILGGIVSVVLDTLAAKDVFRVRVHPSHLQRVEGELRRISRAESQPPVTADHSLPLGGCIVETVSGEIDAGIDSQLSEIERGLSDLLGSAS